MGNEFDPYLRWLGIRDADRPPNHYRLLGLDVYEPDVDIIAEAADRQMAHVRTHQTGPQAGHSQKLLNELAKAKVCLLNSGKKAAYDDDLRSRLAARSAPAHSHGNGSGNQVPYSGAVLPLLPASAGPNSSPSGATPVLPPTSPPAGTQSTMYFSGATTIGGAPPSSTYQECAATPQAPKIVRGRPIPILVRLTVSGGPADGQTYDFRDRGTFTVGRGRQSDFSVSGEPSLSRVHFSIKLNPPCCFLKNLSETHQGTRLNGKAIQETMLNHGDVISWGQETSIRVELLSAQDLVRRQNAAEDA